MLLVTRSMGKQRELVPVRPQEQEKAAEVERSIEELPDGWYEERERRYRREAA